jgi:polysaccharide export outer membrane protein
LVGAVGCKTSKQLAYFQDLSDTSRVQVVNQYPFDPLRLLGDDQVQITISSTSPEASQYFNLMAATPVSSVAGANLGAPTQSFLNVYTVTPKGEITLPVLGDMKVAGLTTEELKRKISTALVPYLKDAVVSVRLINFKVTVIGEVTRPITVPVNGERINVLEAIGAAGDMTVFGKRMNVKVVRRNADGNLDIAHLNFNSSSALKSPYFQLRQNDVVYVEPSKKKGVLGENLNIWVPVITSIASMVIVIFTRVN